MKPGPLIHTKREGLRLPRSAGWSPFLFLRYDDPVAFERGDNDAMIRIQAEGLNPGHGQRELTAGGAGAAL